MSPGRLEWFGSSGIRGPLERVDPELGQRLGRALGARYRRIVVARDARRSGPALLEAVAAGIMASGADVVDAGLVPTPALARTVRTGDADAGVMVTASHNPPPDNGYKVWGETGSALPEEELHDVERFMRDPPARVGWDRAGRRFPQADALARYQADVLTHLDASGFEAGCLEDVRIAVDCAHGAGGLATPHLLSTLGARLTLLGGAPDGNFPDHDSEPTAENLRGLARAVADGGHALGIAHDGDADRAVFLDPSGAIIAMERLLVVLARRRGDGRIAVPVDAGGLLRRALPEAHLEVTPVGDVHLSRAIEDGRATLGAEPSGTWFFADWGPAPEGPYAACLVATMLAHDPDLVKEAMGLPAPSRVAMRYEVPSGADRHGVVAAAATRLSESVAHERILRVDGARVETADGWVLVRASGTEDIVRVTAEADAETRAAELAAAARDAVAAAVETGAPRRDGGAA